ncbi:MAG: peptide/nickel transport system ATP-binding protein [Methanolobus sp.]|uniref:ABC transporter ATP-binding protein n=1 Tax=Methanolobus sp. TaxID=1874737 RepID=UPI00258C631C|nr:ABC transporter ATP-binding protein [Methanolobus sp.]MDK2832655.1 peptide/nickel transport system ATP-binding protein [Methanolobus sp.]
MKSHDMLEVKDLFVEFPTRNGSVKAVDGVSFCIKEGESFGIIGETGSGKSVIGLAILRLLPPTARIKGTILFEGRDVYTMNSREMREMRGRFVSLMPQNPATSLNPVLKNSIQVSEVFEQHGIKRAEGLKKAKDIMSKLLLTDPGRVCDQYPCQLSGGMKQRLLASISLSMHPQLMIADEPTKGLDNESREKTVELFDKIRSEYGSSMLIITHDLDFARDVCDRVAVMYSGRMVEINRAGIIVTSPSHPYAKGLVQALPRNGLVPMDGQSPGRINLPDGCLFYQRCKSRKDVCKKQVPVMKIFEGGRVSCHLY